jgi:hypothetical protein
VGTEQQTRRLPTAIEQSVDGIAIWPKQCIEALLFPQETARGCPERVFRCFVQRWIPYGEAVGGQTKLPEPLGILLKA